jgi:hypothetical protein
MIRRIVITLALVVSLASGRSSSFVTYVSPGIGIQKQSGGGWVWTVKVSLGAASGQYPNFGNVTLGITSPIKREASGTVLGRHLYAQLQAGRVFVDIDPERPTQSVGPVLGLGAGFVLGKAAPASDDLIKAAKLSVFGGFLALGKWDVILRKGQDPVQQWGAIGVAPIYLFEVVLDE